MTRLDNKPSCDNSVADVDAAAAAPVTILKEALFDALAAARIVAVTVDFDGYGDSGQVEGIAAIDAANAPVELPDATIPSARRPNPAHAAAPMPLSEAIEELVYELLADRHDGWENNDGAFGMFVFDVAARRIRLEFHERFVDTLSFEHEF